MYKLENIKEYIVLGIIVLFPFFVASTFIDQFQLPKLILLVTGICLFVIALAIEIYVKGKISFGRGKFDLPVMLLMAVYLIAGLIMTPNKAEAFFAPGNATLMIGFGALYFLINTIADKEKVKYALIVSSVLISFFIFGSFLGIFDKIPQLTAIMKSSTFNPTGDYITSTIFLAVSMVFAINFVIKEKILAKKIAFAAGLVIILFALGISAFNLITNKNTLPVLPPLQTNWAVAVESIKESPILGMGPGNYLTAFNRFRPAAYNSTSIWQLRFSTGGNWYLTVLTEAGILGGIGIAMLLLAVFKMVNRNIDIPMGLLLAALITMAVLPAASTTLMLIFVLLALNSQRKTETISLQNGSNSVKAVVSVVLVALVAVLAWNVRPILLAEYKFKVGYDALAANDGKKTYDVLQQAITLNPNIDRYHASYAQVNLAIARSIANSKKDPKDLTDQEKATITQLVQQAIREGQATVTLNPTRTSNWQVLGNVYQVIIPYANQADQFAVQSYNQAINLDPLDPNLRILLGQIYYSLGKYDDAASTFQFAVLAKPDFANGYYNLAAAYAAKSDFEKAIGYMNTVVTLIPKDSPDYKTVQTDLENLQKKKQSLDSQNSTTLSAPQKEKAAINPPISLPTDASPPAAPKLPNPSPTPLTTASPSPNPNP